MSGEQNDSLSTRTVASYLAEVASGAPTPGGGSVTGVVAALAAALGAMVGRLSEGRVPDEGLSAEIASAVAGLDRLRDRFLHLAEEDEAAYRYYRDAAALPKGTAEEKTARQAAMQQALAGAATVPLTLGRAITDAIALLAPLATHGNRHVLSDAAIAAILAEAAMRGAMVNVRVNAHLMKDRDAAEAMLADARSLEVEARAGVASVLDAIDARSERPAASSTAPSPRTRPESQSDKATHSTSTRAPMGRRAT